ncbi:type I-E CRISPR-associated protein Cas7/Cse4/CasC [Streptomyces sp. RerS4]|uniref:type I-E CRISPR-associated protein Cas7/Cse4/CasC n=1 Tax=Streptomyces sp. RerS4 TaxID=2942449 RepID=UPI00201BB4F6|nr:type I-E CRISPR-associated protein Cas7/Cse4/CasC [Streptomyces sp. RerS4]UQW99101.1 type I-E CRISPR-associated protein Cas7/Cse4/CasC [Streptomyces sp. RerS4]
MTLTPDPLPNPDVMPFLSCHSLFTISHGLPVRDANGQPKSSDYGNAPRLLITPQNQRRTGRTHMRDQANLGQGPLAERSWGIRTREWALAAADHLTHDHGWDRSEALDTAREALSGLGVNFGTTPNTLHLTKVMLFAPEKAGRDLAAIIDSTRAEITTWARAAAKARDAATKPKKKPRAKNDDDDPQSKDPGDGETSTPAPKLPALPVKIKNRLMAALAPADAVDIALYGRFLAEIAGAGNVDGAIQTTTAFTVEPANITTDFFSSADDRKIARQRQGTDFANMFEHLNAIDPTDGENSDGENPAHADDRGAGMTGYQSFISGTFYAHSALDRPLLRRNLRHGGVPADEVEALAIDVERAFLDAFVNAFSRSKQNTTAVPGTLPKLVLVHEGERPYNYAAVFEDAIQPADGAPSLLAARRLLRHHDMITRKRGTVPGAVLTYDLAIGELLEELTLTGRLGPTEVHTPEDLTPLTAGLPV